jgi:hypothetical protein
LLAGFVVFLGFFGGAAFSIASVVPASGWLW